MILLLDYRKERTNNILMPGMGATADVGGRSLVESPTAPSHPEGVVDLGVPPLNEDPSRLVSVESAVDGGRWGTRSGEGGQLPSSVGPEGRGLLGGPEPTASVGPEGRCHLLRARTTSPRRPEARLARVSQHCSHVAPAHSVFALRSLNKDTLHQYSHAPQKQKGSKT
jgi:hypothetical protein